VQSGQRRLDDIFIHLGGLFMSKAIKKLFFGRAAEEFGALGFKKRNKDKYAMTLGKPGIFGTVFIASHSRAGVFSVYVVVGIRDKEIEEEMQRCMGHGPRSTFLSSISTPLGYLTPENSFKEYQLDDEDKVFEYIDSISGQIKKYAMPFFNEYGSREKICECFNLKKYAGGDSLCYRVPIALKLIGQEETAKSYVRDYLAALHAEGSWVFDQYQQFSDRFHT
jgi:hypothetical protein